jgi:flap endonuclease GEN
LQELKDSKRKKNPTSRSKENETSSTSPNSKGVQLNITEFFPTTKSKNIPKHGEESSSSKKNDSPDSGDSKMKRKSSSPNIPKSVRRRLLFD